MGCARSAAGFAHPGWRLSPQELHTDAENGPFSFTLSLTNWDERHFTGGETVLLSPLVLDYWAAPLSAEVGPEGTSQSNVLISYTGAYGLAQGLDHRVNLMLVRRADCKPRVL